MQTSANWAFSSSTDPAAAVGFNGFGVALSSGEGDGRPRKHRLDYGGNRRINSALYIASVVQHRDLPDATTYIDRKLGEGKTRREARRAHKRALRV